MASTGRRLRSGAVILGGMGALAAMLTACSSEPDKRCVDRNSYEMARGYKVLSSGECSTSSRSGSRYAGRNAAWYYDADVENGWAEDGTFTRPTGSHGGSSVHRGGFGHSGKHGSIGG